MKRLVYWIFTIFLIPIITKIYDKQTSDAVRNMQKLSLYPETGNTDKYTWNNIVRFFEHTVK